MTPRLATAVLIALLGASSAFAAPPQTLNYQGRVKLLGGGPVANSATNTVQVRLCEDAGCAVVAWSDTFTNVATVDGLFNLVLGSGAPLNIPFDKPYWIGINFNGDGEMTPRSPLTSAPYAFRAIHADNATIAAPLSLTGPTFAGSSAFYAEAGTSGAYGLNAYSLYAGGAAVQGSTNHGSGIGVRAVNSANGWSLESVGASYLHNSDPVVPAASIRNLGAGLSLSVTGGSRFAGSTTFTGQVDFSGAAVTGLSVGAPLSLTSPTSASAISAYNPNGGYAIYASSAASTAIFGISSLTNAIQGQIVAVTSGTSGIVGTVSGGTAQGYGVKGEVFAGNTSTNSASIMGIFKGAATPILQAGAGVVGVNDQSLGVGVYGRAQGVNSTGGAFRGSAFGLSATASGGGASAIYAKANSTAMAADVFNDGSGPGLQAGSSSGVGVIGTSVGSTGVRGTTSSGAGSAGVQGWTSNSTGLGVLAEHAGAGAGVALSATASGSSASAIVAQANSSAPTALLANNGAGPALRLSGNARVDSASNTITMASFVSFTAGTNLGAAVPNPLNLVGNQPYSAAVITASNTGSGHGIAGVATQPGITTGPVFDFSDTLTAGVFGRTSVSMSAGVLGWAQVANPESAGVLGMAQSGSGVYGVGVGTGATGGSFDALGGIGVQGRGLTGVAAKGETSGGAAIVANAFSPSDRALHVQSGTSRLDGRTEVYASPVANVFALSVGVTGGSQGGAVYGNTGASITAAVRGESTDTTSPGPGLLPGRGVEGSGPVGVYGTTTVSNGVGVLSIVNTPGSPSLFAQNLGGGAALEGESAGGEALRAVGFTRGGEFSVKGAGGTGVYVHQSLGAKALEVWGNATFGPGFGGSGSVTFGSHVDFSGAVVTGLALPGVPNPLMLVTNTASATIEGQNFGSGPGLRAQTNGSPAILAQSASYRGAEIEGRFIGVSATAMDGVAGVGAWLQGRQGAVAAGVDQGLSATASAGGGTGVLAQAGGTGVYAQGGNFGLYGYSTGGTGVYAQSVGAAVTALQAVNGSGRAAAFLGSTYGLSATATSAFGTGVYAAGTTAFDADGPIDVRAKSGVGNSAANTGRIYFDQGANRFRVSENGGAWQDLVVNGGDFVMKAGDTMTGTLNLPVNGLTVGTQQLVAAATNRIGMGIATPATALDIRFSAAALDGIRLQGGSASSTPSYSLYSSASSEVARFAYVNSSAQVQFGTLGSAPLVLLSNGTERLRINTAGQIGIGNNNPGSLLDLSGALTQRGMGAPGVSSAGEGRIYFDSGSNKFRVSESAGNYKDLLVSAPLTLTNTVTNASTIFAANTAAGGGNAIFGLGSATVAYSGVVGSTTVTVPYSGTNKASVYGYTDVGSGLGVLGLNAYGDGVGVMGGMGPSVPSVPAAKRIGVMGSSTYWGGDSIGVYGVGNNQGVVGSTSGLPGAVPDLVGVFGYSPVGGGIGVAGQGTAVGVSASSAAGNAVYAQSNGSFAPTSYFIQGTNSGTAGSAIAVYGQARNSSAGIGIFGYNASTAPSFPAAGAAVYGYADSANSAAIWGRSTNGGSTPAVVAEGAGIGLSATASSVGGRAILASASTNQAVAAMVNNGPGQVLNLSANNNAATEALYIYQGTAGTAPGIYVEADNGTGNGVEVVVSGGKGVLATGATVGVEGKVGGAATPALPSGGVGVLGANASGAGYAGFLKASGAGSRGLVVESVAIGISATSSATASQPAIYANLNSTSNAIHAINDGSGIGVLGQGTGAGTGVRGSLISANGGTAVHGLANSANSFGVSAANIGATVAGGGAALMVNGIIRVSQSSVSVAPVAATTANVDGSNIRVSFSAGGAFQTLTVNNTDVTANSAVMLAFNTTNQPGAYVVRVAAGVITINLAASLTVSSGQGVNIVVINN